MAGALHSLLLPLIHRDECPAYRTSGSSQGRGEKKALLRSAKYQDLFRKLLRDGNEQSSGGAEYRTCGNAQFQRLHQIPNDASGKAEEYTGG